MAVHPLQTANRMHHVLARSQAAVPALRRRPAKPSPEEQATVAVDLWDPATVRSQHAKRQIQVQL